MVTRQLNDYMTGSSKNCNIKVKRHKLNKQKNTLI